MIVPTEDQTNTNLDIHWNQFQKSCFMNPHNIENKFLRVADTKRNRHMRNQVSQSKK